MLKVYSKTHIKIAASKEVLVTATGFEPRTT